MGIRCHMDHGHEELGRECLLKKSIGSKGKGGSELKETQMKGPSRARWYPSKTLFSILQRCLTKKMSPHVVRSQMDFDLTKVTTVIQTVKLRKMQKTNSEFGDWTNLSTSLRWAPQTGLSQQSCHSPAPMTFSLLIWLGWISVANLRTAVLGSSYVCGST